MQLSDLPLTTLLRYKDQYQYNKGCAVGNGKLVRDTESNTTRKLPFGKPQITELNANSIQTLFEVAENDKTIVNDGCYMFGPLYSDLICISPPSKGIRVSKLKYQTVAKLKQILSVHTSWYKLLKEQVQNSLIGFVHVRSRSGELDLSAFRRVLEAVDHIVIGFYLSGEESKVITLIQTSLLSQLVVTGEKGYFVYLKRYKKLVKTLRKAVLEQKVFAEIPREFSWICKTQFYHRYKRACEPGRVHLWEELQHVMVVLQTRSTGLANGPWMEDSLEKWRGTIQDQETEYTSRYIIQGSKAIRAKIRDSGILSLTSASCLESTRSMGGKFSLMQDIIADIQAYGVPLVNWENGTVSKKVSFLPKHPEYAKDWGTCADWLVDELGEFLFSYAYNLYLQGEKSPQGIGVSTVIEQGKARVVTPDSIILYLLLMPLSHSTLRCFEQIEEIKVGVSQTDDGWQFWKRMGPSELQEDGEYNFVFLNADLETATDYAPWTLVESTLQLMSKLGVPGWYLEVAKTMLCAPRPFARGRGIHRTQRGAMMADPGTKSILSISHYCIIKSVEQDLNVTTTFALKGDDVIIKIPRNVSKRFFDLYKNRMEASGFKLSEEDTFLSKRHAFYCESVFRQYHLTSDSPTSWEQMVDKRDPSYCDIPMVKLAFPVYKNNRRIGETPEGKISLLSKKKEWFKPGSYMRFQLDILDIIQTFTFRLDEFDKVFLFSAKWRGGLAKSFPLGNTDLISMTPDEKKDIMLSYLFIINRVLDKIPENLKLTRNELHQIEKESSRFFLRTDNDDQSNQFKSLDFTIPLEPLWSSADERIWGLPLGNTLKRIKGLATDKSIKSKYVTLCNLSGTEINYSESLTGIGLRWSEHSTEVIKSKLDVANFQTAYNYVQQVGNRQYNYVNWEIYRESGYPLYNALKVNPADRQGPNNVDSLLNRLSQMNNEQIEQEAQNLQAEYSVSRQELLSLLLAIRLHNRTLEAELDQIEYDRMLELSNDFDQQVVIKLASRYNQLATFQRNTPGLFSNVAGVRKLRKEGLLPKNYILWLSNDSHRYRDLVERNTSYWESLGLNETFKEATKIHIAQYGAVGQQTDYGFVITGYKRMNGFAPGVPETLTEDQIWDYFDDCVGLDFDNLESLAQSARLGEAISDDGYLKQGKVHELGYSKVHDIPGLLTS